MKYAMQAPPAAAWEAEKFLQEHQLDEETQSKLMDLSPQLQAIVMKKGTLHDARDQNAVLNSRIKQVKSIASGDISGCAGDAKPGDWCCPGCFDIQFARNNECRKCRTPKPMMDADDGFFLPEQAEEFLG